MTIPAKNSSFFPHMVVGEIQKPSQEFLAYLISYDITHSALFDEIKSHSEKEIEELKSVIEPFINSSSIILTKDALLSILPTFDEIIESLSQFNGIGEVPNIVIPVDFEDSIAKIWDSIFVHYIKNNNPILLGDLILTLKVHKLKKGIDALGYSNSEVVSFWKKSQVLFPNPPFPLLKNKPKTTFSVTPTPRETNESTLLLLKAINDARLDILSVYELQNENLKRATFNKSDFTKRFELSSKDIIGQDTPPIVFDINSEYNKYQDQSNGEDLSDESVKLLKRETLATLVKNGIPSTVINVPFVLKRLVIASDTLNSTLKRTINSDQVILIGGTLISIENAIYSEIICEPEATYTHCDLIKKLTVEYPQKTYVQVLGIGDANVIRQKVVRHETGEVAHIENILKGESKEKTHRNLKIQEDFFSSQIEKNQETETDSKSTSRFELSKEMSSIVNEDAQTQAGATISGGYGPVYATASVGYSSSSSSSQTDATSLQTAKEISERATQRIQERSLEIRESRTINEVEVTNLHKVDNSAGTEHINGVYYWVDKVYENQMFNIGKRLMLEVMIPEPAAFHIFSSAKARVEGVSLDKPIHPSEFIGNGITFPLKSFNDINSANYHVWAAIYGAQNIEPQPTDILTISNAYCLDYTPGDSSWHDQSHKDLKIPEGYEADFGRMNIGISGGSGRYLAGYIGSKYFSCTTMMIAPIVIPLNQETDIVPLSFRGHFDEYNMNVEIVCKLSRSGYDKWRISTYNAIIAAYEQKKEEYNSKVSEIESVIQITGQNPRINREIERTELKKWSLELLTLQRFEGFNAMKKATNGHPEIDFDEAFAEGSFVKFFEQAIEWQNMTYMYYPYFWGNKPRWNTLKQLSDDDFLFTKFLQAGYARVVIPVHPKFTKAILHYLESGEIWNGAEVPAINDELYIGIAEAIQASEDNTDGIEVGDAWETKVPTNLLFLANDIPDNLPGS